MGRVSTICTTSPILHSDFSSCANNFLFRRTYLPKSGSFTVLWTRTVTVFCILLLTTFPTFVFFMAFLAQNSQNSRCFLFLFLKVGRLLVSTCRHTHSQLEQLYTKFVHLLFQFLHRFSTDITWLH